MRMFASLVPPRPVLDDLDTALSELSGPSRAVEAGVEAPALRWVPEHQRHITLAFHGEVPDQDAEKLRTELTAIAAATPPPRLRLAGAGVFDDRVLWAGVQAHGTSSSPSSGSAEAAQDPLVELMLACRDVVAEDDAPRRADPEAPMPHLTLARTPRRGVGVELLRGLAEQLADYVGPEWTVGELLLMRSRLGDGPRGTARHTVVAELPLAG